MMTSACLGEARNTMPYLETERTPQTSFSNHYSLLTCPCRIWGRRCASSPPHSRPDRMLEARGNPDMTVSWYQWYCDGNTHLSTPVNKIIHPSESPLHLVLLEVHFEGSVAMGLGPSWNRLIINIWRWSGQFWPPGTEDFCPWSTLLVCVSLTAWQTTGWDLTSEREDLITDSEVILPLGIICKSQPGSVAVENWRSFKTFAQTANYTMQEAGSAADSIVKAAVS